MSGLSRKDAMQAQLKAREGSMHCTRQLQKIGDALRRIKTGEYGKCFICEEKLDDGRLFNDPTITRCMNCVEL